MGLGQRNGIFGVLPARKMVREPKRGKRGRGRKETLADKPLGFENRLLDLSCLSAHTKISCCHRLSELSRTYQDMSETTSSRNGEISINPNDQCSFWNCNCKISPSKSINFKGEEVLALICQSGSKGAFAAHARGKKADPQIGSSVIACDKIKQRKVFSKNVGIWAGKASNIWEVK